MYGLNDDIVANQIGILQNEYCRSFTYFREIERHLSTLNKNREFWVHLHNTLLNDAVLKWCKVFGADDNEVHWKKSSQNKEFHAAVRENLLYRTGFTLEEWKAYHQIMRDFRNSYSAHRNISALKPVPWMDKSFDVAASFFDFIVDQYHPWAGHQPYLGEVRKHYQDEIISIISSLKSDNSYQAGPKINPLSHHD